MSPKKKKKSKAKTAVLNAETEEELLALAAIYGDEFFKHHDGLGFDLFVVPHPGLLAENFVRVQLSVRYPHSYPAQPVALKLKNPEGLSPDECRDLLARLTRSAAEHADAEEVCAFDLVDMCQEVLRAANERRQQGLDRELLQQQQEGWAEEQGPTGRAAVAGDQAHGQSLWHSMQRRNGGLGADDSQQQQQHIQALDRHGSVLGSLAAEASVLSLGEDMPSVGQVGGLGGGLWGYDDGLYDMDDSVDMDTGLFGPPSPPTLQSPERARLPPSSAAAVSATVTAAAAMAGMSPLKAGSPVAADPKPASLGAGSRLGEDAGGVGTAVLDGGAHVPKGRAGGDAAVAAVATSAVREGSTKLKAAAQPKARTGAATRPSPFERQPQSRASRVPAAVLARRLPRVMRALVGGGNSASTVHSVDERSRHRLRRSRAKGPGKVSTEARRGNHGRQEPSDTTSGDGSSSSSGGGTEEGNHHSSSSNDSGGSAKRPSGGVTDARGGAGTAGPGRLWARGGDSSDTSSGSSEEEDEEDSSSSSSTDRRGHRMQRSGGASGSSLLREPSSSDVKLPLLLGHLLTMAAAGTSLDARGASLEALFDHLRRRGLLPQWLHWLVTRQPQLFEQAFNRVFDEDMRAAAATAVADRGGPEPRTDSRTLTRFWNRQTFTASLGLSGAGGSQRKQHPLQHLPAAGARVRTASGGGALAAALVAASRYLSDFQELRRLGKGGFGVVVAAVNRLDGRQYAVKKIKLDSGSPSSYTRITREVATLSRLQHPNVVRYFQAWCENLPAGVGLEGSEDEEDEFGEYSDGGEEEQEDDGTVDGGVEDSDENDAWGFGYSQSSDSRPPTGQVAGQRRATAVAAAPSSRRTTGHQTSQKHHRHAHANGHTLHQHHHHHHQPHEPRSLAPVREEAAELASAFGSSADDPAETASEVSASTAATSSITPNAGSGAGGRAGGVGFGASARTGSGDTTGPQVGADSGSEGLPSAGGSMGERRPGLSLLAGCDDSTETNTTQTTTATTTATTMTIATDPMTTATTATTSTAGAGHRQSDDRRRRYGAYRRRQASHTSTSGAPTQMLYIQMEFCPRTLAEVLQEGPLQEEDAWRVLRGILTGLAYIHSQGVIHRDLKPANIFYGANGEIKLGDFGLAKFHSSTSAEDPAAATGLATPQGAPGAGAGAAGPAAASGPSAAAAGAAGAVAGAPGHSWRAGGGGADGTAPSERTGVCGSFFYISPEIKNGWARYDEKVDLWSLGVVVFELWHPFATGMERAVLLNDLRDHARLPEAWERAHTRVARLIRWLMAPNPGERPSAREVLASDLLPPRVEDEQLKDLLRYLPSNPDATERVVAALFSLTEGRGRQPGGAAPAVSAPSGGGGPHWPPAAGPGRTSGSSASLDVAGGLGPLPFDGTELPGAPRVQHAQARDDVIRMVRSVFECHGARSFYSNQVGYAYPGLAPDAVRLLSPHGAVLAMRHEMRYPFAVWLVQQLALEQATGALDTLRRYDISYVMRSGRARSLPTSYCQADLDLLHAAGGSGGHPDKGRLLAEAEAIKAVTQVLDHFAPELGRYEVRITHRNIERALYDSMGLSPAAAAAVVAGGASGGGAAAAAREAEVAVRRLIATALRASPMLGAVRGELRYKAWPSVKAGLDGLGLPADRVARCKRCVCELPGDVQGALTRLKAYLQEAGGAAAAAAAMAAGPPGSQATSLSAAAAEAAARKGPAAAGAGTSASAAAKMQSPLARSAAGSGAHPHPHPHPHLHPHPAPLPAALAMAMEEVAVVVQLLDVWGVPASQVVLDPLMAPAAEYYSGVFFQVHLLGLPAAPGQQGSGAGAALTSSSPLGLLHGAGPGAQNHLARPATVGMVAVGGRYDALIRALWATTTAAAASPAAHGHPHVHSSAAACYAYASLPGAVGATLNVERLIAGLTQQRAASAGAAAYSMGLLRSLETSKADVLVCARGGDGALTQRMALVSALWSAGVRAELMPRPAPSLSDQYAYAQARGVRAVVILGDRDALSGDVTIKSLDKRSESVVVPLQDAPRQLAAALAAGSSAGRGVAGAVASSVVHTVYGNAGGGGKDAAIAALFAAGGGQRQGGGGGGSLFGGGGGGGAHGGGKSDTAGGGSSGGGGGRERDRDRDRSDRDRGGGRGDEGGGGAAGRRGGAVSETDRDRERERDRDHDPWDRDREGGGDRQAGGERERRGGGERHHHWGDRELRGRRGKGGG